jgi:heat shock protein HslJ
MPRDHHRTNGRRSYAALLSTCALAACAGRPSAPATPADPAVAQAGAPDAWEEARRRGVDFRALGQEPGWLLDVDEGGEMRFLGDYGQTRVAARTPAAERAPGGGFTLRTDALTAEVVPADCRDAMSGAAYPYAVTVRQGGRVHRGCGRLLAAAEPTDVHWRLVQLGSSPAVATSGATPPSLRLDGAAARASGSTGCNQFGGSFTRDGEQLRFGPLATTRRACTDPALERQETIYLRVLASTDGARVAGDTLVLLSGGAPAARFAAERFR